MAKDKHGIPSKTNVARLLDKADISYELIPYEVDEENLAAGHVAEQLGEDIRRSGHFVCVIPGDAEVDLKKAAKAAGAKKADLIPMKELLPLTGYIRGGCSPVGMKKPLPTFFHSTAMDFGYIFVSAGVRGLQVRIAPDRLIDYVGAEVCDLVHCVSVENCEEAGV